MPDAPNQQVALGEAIRYIREREGLTQEELAFQAGLHPTWISRIESGQYDPRWSSVRQLLEGLGVTLVELVAMAERMELD
jgi:XRE family transcriptional regulator, regulator of sulfur utilization